MSFPVFGRPFGRGGFGRPLGSGGGGGALTPAQQRAAYDALLAWTLAYKFNEVAGTTVVNSGSLGSGNATWTPGAGALGQTGQLGSNEAYLFDGADSIVTGPTSTTINNATAFTYLMLLNLAGNGEGSACRLFADNGQNRAIFAAGSPAPFRYNVSIAAATTNASCTTAVGAGFATSTWTTCAVTYDDAGDRKPHVYFGTAAGLAEATYSAQVAAVGALTNGSGSLFVGNRSGADRTIDGLYDEFRFKTTALSLAQLQEWNRLAFLAA